jgi:hypothetical protein
MKNRYLILFLTMLLILPGSLYAQKKSKSWLKTGTTLTYQVTVRSKQYNFIIRDLILDSNYTFNWEMTEPNNMTGSVVMGRQALDTATTQQNTFQAGENMLTDRTTVWVSKKVYNAIKKKKPVRIDSGSGKTELIFKEKQDYTFTLNGSETSVKVLFAETNSANKFWILDDKENPLILKMNLGWTVILKEASDQK